MCNSRNPMRDELAALRAAAERLRTRTRGGRAPAEMADELRELRQACNLVELEFAVVAAEFADTEEYAAQGAVSPSCWIRHECQMTGHAAAGALCVGSQVSRLPRSIEALEAGRIGFAHLALMAGTARAVSESPSAVAPFDETRLLKAAERELVNRFRGTCAHVRHAADAAGFLAEQNEQVELRWLRLLPCDDGALVVRGMLDSVGGAALRTALEPLARRTGPDDERDLGRRFADALVELAAHGLDQGVVPARASQRSHLQVTATVETLMGLRGAAAAELEFSPPVAAATVQRLACDATITRVLLDAQSAVIDVGRSQRVVPGSTRRALNVRDRGCRWPGCDRPVSWTAAHHVIHWVHGGDTDMSNLVHR
ncbi:MAG: HNH endonuclease [Candidatus Dormibacteraeota bacterium]|nr:HNH endonuclease [Candidatus Dormibacteraeota bacterium]